MRLYEKYKQLQNESYLIEQITNSVYATMQLEDQGLPKQKIREIVKSVVRENQLKGGQFFIDQPV